MIRFFKNIKIYFKKINFVKIQKRKLSKKGTLLNAFKEKKLIFIHIPKTAGISLVKAFFGEVTLEGHRSLWFYKQVFKSDFKEYFTFTIVRNPWDRLYSAYEFLEKGGINIHDKNAYQIHLSQFKDFEDFVLNGLTENILSEITHFIPQSEFICDNKGNIMLDYVGRFEDLNKSVDTLNKRLNLNVMITHHNTNEKVSYTEVYTEQMIDKVSDIYKIDIELLNYNFI